MSKIEIEIKSSEIADVYELSKNLRQKDKEELVAMGYRPRTAVYYSFKHAVYRKTAFVDGRIAAMWGVCGCPLGIVGQPYLLTTKKFERPGALEITRLYKKEVSVMHQIFPVLENYVDYNYDDALRLLRLVGFTIHRPQPLGPRNNMFCRYTMGDV